MIRFDKNSLVSQILVVFIIFNAIAISAFTVYVLQQDKKRANLYMEDSLQEIAAEKANTISLVMGQIEKEADSFAELTEEYLSAEANTTLPAEYKIREDGILYRQVQKNDLTDHSVVFFPANGKLNSDVIKGINATEKLDPMLKKLMERNPHLQWAYIATEDGLLRIFPGASIDVFDPNHMQKYDPFYVVANKENNPERKTVWSSPYVDYMGRGWMITCSVPLYTGDQFIGVACVDVKLDTIQKEFLADFRLGDSGFAYLLENTGAIIYHPAFVPRGSDQGQTFLTNIITDTSLDKNYKTALKKVLSGSRGIVSYIDPTERNQNKMIAYATVGSLPWKLAVEINQSQYLSIHSIENTSLIFFGLGILIIFTCLASFLYRQYSKPFNHLIRRAKSISEGDYGLKETISNYTEIETLSDAFNTMSTEIKEYTDSLIKKNQEIESIINGIGGMLMILNPKLDIIAINDKSIDALKKSVQQIKGRKCYEAIVGCSEICSGCKVTESMEARTKQHARIAIGDDIFQNTYFPILSDNNEVLEIVVYSQKITKRVLMEKELAQSEKMSEIGQLTSAIAHELKNPLAVIKGAAYLLNAYTKEYRNESIDASLETIAQTTEYAEKAIYNLLEFSSPSRNKQIQGNVTKIIDQVILLTRRNSIHRNIEIETSFSPNPLFYFGDIEPLKHVFLNLITNAINAIEDGGKIIITGVCEQNEKGERLLLTVEDNGAGIEEKLQEKIFEPFFTTDETGKGSGMGLWITKIMIEKMQGTIQLISKPGKGSKFMIALPVDNSRRTQV
jgi:Signal transduction histidine kinase